MVALPSVMRAYSGDVLALRAKLVERAQAELEEHVQEVQVGPEVRLDALLETDLDRVPVEQAIAQAARDRQAQLVCLALGGRRLDHGLLIGSVSQRLLRVLPCSLLALPDRWVSDRA